MGGAQVRGLGEQSLQVPRFFFLIFFFVLVFFLGSISRFLQI
jgi:hypothetical protein